MSQIFHILRINRMMPFLNLFIRRPSYMTILTTWKGPHQRRLRTKPSPEFWVICQSLTLLCWMCLFFVRFRRARGHCIRL